MPNTVDPDPTTGSSSSRPGPSQVGTRDRHPLEPSTHPIPRHSTGDRGGNNSSWDLLRLLHDFKAARQRRDGALFGSRDWRAADEEIQDLQHEIFDRSFDDASGIGARGGIDAIGRTAPGPDDELGQPEDPFAI